MNTSITVDQLHKAFLQHAKKDMHIAIIAGPDDINASNDLADQLESARIKCWSAKRLTGGNDWKMDYEVAIKEADFVIVLLSKKTLLKSGPHNSFMSLALNQQKEKPEGRIKTLCVLLEECEIPHSFQFLQPMAGYKEGGVNMLSKAIEHEWSQRKMGDDWPKRNEDANYKYRWGVKKNK